MKNVAPVFFIITCAFLAFSCKEIIEPSIASRKVKVQAPSDGYTSAVYKVGFWWEEVEDALKYRLQVVTPSFASPGQLVLDTLIDGLNFSVNMNPGSYEWRLRAENGSSVTVYSSERSFTVLQSSIRQQSVQLAAPVNNLLTRNGAVTFSWSELYGASRYQLQIDTNGFANEDALVLKSTITTQQYHFTLLKDQIYQWRVRAENDTAESKWSATNLFTYDHTPPEKVVLTLPADKDNVNGPVSMKWASSQGAAKYKLYLLTEDGVSPYSDAYPKILNTNSYSFTAGNSRESIFWRVVAIDAAGNESELSETRSFSIL